LNGDVVACGVTWSAAGPIDTAPLPSDVTFSGPVDGGAGDITVVLDGGRTSVKSVVVAGVAVPPCTATDNPLDLHLLLEPPATIESDGSFGIEVLMFHGDQFRAVSLQGNLVDPDAVEATLLLQSIPTAECNATVGWSAQLPQPVTATPTPTATATPGIAAATPTAAVAGLPSAGQGSSGGSSPWLFALLATTAVAMVGAPAIAILRRVLR
jgi:hypothetical protein